MVYSLIKHKRKKIEHNSKYNAVDLIEIYGYAAALIGADTALKTADVRLLALDKTRGKPHTPGLIMFLKLGGRVDDVRTAVEAALEKITPLTGSTSSSVIAHPDIWPMK
ncbi:MAG: BMC domain-containing protein [Halanaerobiaceae bacterium]